MNSNNRNNSSERTNEKINEKTNERTNERTNPKKDPTPTNNKKPETSKKSILENNSLLKQLDKKAEEEFEKILRFFNNDENKEDKILFYKFLFSDIISKKILNEDKEIININNVINQPKYSIDKYIYETLENNSNKEISLKEEIKKGLYQSKVKINKKINECIDNINILKKIFLNLNLEKKLPSSNEQIELSFKNKTVLVSDNLKIGEIFARYIFSLISDDDESICQIENFYSSERINSYIIDEENNNIENKNKPKNKQNGGGNENEENEDESDDEESEDEESEDEETGNNQEGNKPKEIQNNKKSKIKNNLNNLNKSNKKIKIVIKKDFSKIDNNFKYWIFLIKLITQLFSNNSDYDIIFNFKKLINEIDKLVVIEKENQSKKDSKKKKKEKVLSL